jgi:hypothetical protein
MNFPPLRLHWEDKYTLYSYPRVNEARSTGIPYPSRVCLFAILTVAFLQRGSHFCLLNIYRVEVRLWVEG